jgi:hypothetical protein
MHGNDQPAPRRSSNSPAWLDSRRLLTPAEQEKLRRDFREAKEIMIRYFRENPPL